jgi:hypothetical protein
MRNEPQAGHDCVKLILIYVIARARRSTQVTSWISFAIVSVNMSWLQELCAPLKAQLVLPLLTFSPGSAHNEFIDTTAVCRGARALFLTDEHVDEFLTTLLASTDNNIATQLVVHLKLAQRSLRVANVAHVALVRQCLLPLFLATLRVVDVGASLAAEAVSAPAVTKQELLQRFNLVALATFPMYTAVTAETGSLLGIHSTFHAWLMRQTITCPSRVRFIYMS